MVLYMCAGALVCGFGDKVFYAYSPLPDPPNAYFDYPMSRSGISSSAAEKLEGQEGYTVGYAQREGAGRVSVFLLL